MAKGLRSRPKATLAVALKRAGFCGIVLLVACGQPAAPTAIPAAQAEARKVSIDDYADDQLVAAVLDECHAPLKKRMQQIKVTVTLPDQRRILVHADLPHRTRIHDGKRSFLLRNGLSFRLDEGELNEVDNSLTRHLATLVDAVAFGPLYRAISCRREDAGYVLTDPQGLQSTLTLYEGTLLPRSLTYDKQIVHIDDYLRTKTAWVAKQATIKPLGTCDVFFEDGGLVFGKAFFSLPTAAAKANTDDRIRMPSPGTVRETESQTPIIIVGKATQWALLTDPGDWGMRHTLYQPVHDELESQDQLIAGFPMLFDEGGKHWLAVPFRQRKRGKAAPAHAAREIRTSPETRMLVVYPQNGRLEQRIKSGNDQLQRALANRKLVAIGPIVAQPFIHLHDSAPATEKLADCKVRMSVRIK